MPAFDRRAFLTGSTIAAATAVAAPAVALPKLTPAGDMAGHAEVARFGDWTVYEDQTRRDGPITFVSGGQALVLGKRLEACFDDITPSYLGLALKDICLADADLLADTLLAGGGDPDPQQVRRAAPPLGWNFTPESLYTRLAWTNFVGTRQQGDTMPVFPNGRTRGYRPEHDFPELQGDAVAKTRWEGLLGGWLPAIHKIIQVSDSRYYDLIVFADVKASDPLLVQTWHRTVQYDNGKPVKTRFGYSYAPFPPRREEPEAAQFYQALFDFAAYWHTEVRDQASVSLPDGALSDMVSHAFVKELITRPSGTYPKYGVVDRDYFGPEYDGFQDIFTSSLYANLEWGRFGQAKAVIDNYFDQFVAPDGMINMRGPEVPQFGLTLSLLARYLTYTGDAATLNRHAGKIANTVTLLTELHDLSLKKPAGDPGFGLIDGWSESDACLHPDPSLWWKPYWNNSAFAVRGWRDIARVWPLISRDPLPEVSVRADRLQAQLVKTMRASVRTDLTPPYLAVLPGTRLTHREAYAEAHEKKQRTEQGWAHRVYAELLHADVLPDDLAQTVIDGVRGHGGTCIGVVANIAPANETSRSQLGFISYGYAQQLLRSDRIEEYLLFLYSHRYHSHTPGTWVAGEVSDIDGGLPLYCVPAQLTIPKLVRWMLVFEASDSETLYLGRAIPRDWFALGQPIAITGAPTRWGRVDLSLKGDMVARVVTGTIALHGAARPQEVRLRIRLPKGKRLKSVRISGKAVRLEGDTAVFAPGGQQMTLRADLA
ncbi:Tat pathway signal protein [Asticcacaulis sp. 201]|uniref:Tat pathway signal protein n=1 Tax=Asticcacaulis sp. 201 TaxID=3028787 RepID=UPI002916370F|nr:Tat pathway signal protein [Asticcacaulis sp. 201]MDV6330349.1 Tat pathway signal protein [Asticcacaulis sp. 201]